MDSNIKVYRSDSAMEMGAAAVSALIIAPTLSFGSYNDVVLM